jgi:hypothetical protein
MFAPQLEQSLQAFLEEGVRIFERERWAEGIVHDKPKAFWSPRIHPVAADESAGEHIRSLPHRCSKSGEILL